MKCYYICLFSDDGDFVSLGKRSHSKNATYDWRHKEGIVMFEKYAWKLYLKSELLYSFSPRQIIRVSSNTVDRPCTLSAAGDWLCELAPSIGPSITLCWLEMCWRVYSPVASLKVQIWQEGIGSLVCFGFNSQISLIQHLQGPYSGVISLHKVHEKVDPWLLIGTLHSYSFGLKQ